MKFFQFVTATGDKITPGDLVKLPGGLTKFYRGVLVFLQGDLYSINPVNGNKTLLFNTGVNKLSGLASPLNNLRLPRPPRPRPTPAPRP